MMENYFQFVFLVIFNLSPFSFHKTIQSDEIAKDTICCVLNLTHSNCTIRIPLPNSIIKALVNSNTNNDSTKNITLTLHGVNNNSGHTLGLLVYYHRSKKDKADARNDSNYLTTLILSNESSEVIGHKVSKDYLIDLTNLIQNIYVKNRILKQDYIAISFYLKTYGATDLNAAIIIKNASITLTP